MDIRKTILERKSTREFKNKYVSTDILDSAFELSKNKRNFACSANTQAMIIEDGEHVAERLDGMLGYGGYMIKAPQYIAIFSDPVENHLMNTGYYGEMLVLALCSLGIDSTWISLPEDTDLIKRKLNIDNQKVLSGMLAIGYGKSDRKVEDAIDTGENYSKTTMHVVENNTSTRVRPEELVYHEKWGNKITYDQLTNLGLQDIFYYARMAPSTLNRQPWKFLLKDRRIYLAIKKDERNKEQADMLDAGIMMLYMDLLLKAYNISGKWIIAPVSAQNYGIPDDYFVAGYFE